ncbi:DUF6809 family protein [Ruminococcus sp. JL13D9]|uniref:DUF6809 family protein n=1 Tax=Ruminococcus sp. JL13D9 TaxID=3233381 RepID=UPI00389A80BE
MDFFSELYHGDIYPEEEIAVHIATDPKYKELSSNLSQVAAQLTNQDENIQQLVKQYRDGFDKLIGLHELHAFKIGFIRGAELKRAISKTNNEPSV